MPHRVITSVDEEPRPLSPEERAKALAVVLEEADRIRAEIKKRRKGNPVPSSTREIREFRERDL